MKVTYFALVPLTVGDEIRQPGDLVPEAADWPHIRGYIADGKLAPVLVSMLPAEQQATLLGGDDEEPEVDEVPPNQPQAPEPTQPKQRRARRTKAQIEADNARLATKEAV